MIPAGIGIQKNRAKDIGFLKQYAPNYFKLVHMNSVCISGLELRMKDGEERKKNRRTSDSSEKLINSISRSRRLVYEIALCNDWDYFVTLTLSPEKNNRFSLNESYKRMSKWFNNLSRCGFHVRYLLVPEPHEDGAWHFHGLIQGIPPPELTPFTLGDHIPNSILNKIRSGQSVFNWPAYADAFGYVTFEPIKDRERCAAYMTKYITKELGLSGIELNHHLYYASQGLKRAKVIYRGPMVHAIENPDFENDYVHIKKFSDAIEAIQYFCDEE